MVDMKKMAPNKTHREHVFIRALGITALFPVVAILGLVAVIGRRKE